MDQLVDEHTASDLREIAEWRQLSVAQRDILSRNVTGTLRPNRDIFLWVLANVLSALMLCRFRRQKTFDPADYALEIIMCPRPELRSTLARHCDGHDDVRVTGEGLAVDAPELKFAAGWARVEDALAFSEFFVLGSEGALLGGLKEAAYALRPVDGAAAGPREAVGILSRHIAQWRREHLPLARYERLVSALVGFLANRPPVQRGHGLFDFNDEDIIAFWRKCVEAGERLMFKTAVERFRDFARLMTQQSAIRNLATPGDLDALAARIDVEPDESWSDTADDVAEKRLLDALNGLPSDPKVLTGVEKDSIAAIVALMPFHKQRAGSVLRVLAFGPVQTGIANRLRRRSGGPEVAARVGCEDAESYDNVAVCFGALLAHLEMLLRIAGALRFCNAAAAEGTDPALVKKIRQGNDELRRMRRQGFDRPREEIAARFAEIDGVLSELCGVVRDFTVELDRLDARQAYSERFARDKPVFIEIFKRAYIERENDPDVSIRH